MYLYVLNPGKNVFSGQECTNRTRIYLQYQQTKPKQNLTENMATCFMQPQAISLLGDSFIQVSPVNITCRIMNILCIKKGFQLSIHTVLIYNKLQNYKKNNQINRSAP